jgi:hypothetical protein
MNCHRQGFCAAYFCPDKEGKINPARHIDHSQEMPHYGWQGPGSGMR